MTPFHPQHDTSLLLRGEEDFSDDVTDLLYEKHGAHVRYTRCPCGSLTFHIAMHALICAHCTAEITSH